MPMLLRVQVRVVATHRWAHAKAELIQPPVPQAAAIAKALRRRHSHTFHITVYVPTQGDRQYEFIALDSVLTDVAQVCIDRRGHDFSCETLANDIVLELKHRTIDATRLEVSEDGLYGAIWRANSIV